MNWKTYESNWRSALLFPRNNNIGSGGYPHPISSSSSSSRSSSSSSSSRSSSSIGRHTNELGFNFFPKTLRMNWKTYECIGIHTK